MAQEYTYITTLEPIQATFRGGMSEPLHDWFPYLEGYSPRFVEQILREFAPGATAVLDPFAGSGTTPLTAALLGKASYYCEVNPLLQYLVSVKARSSTLPETARRKLATDLRITAASVGRTLRRSNRDEKLDRSYGSTFGDSKFFDDDVYDKILRSRTLIDELSCSTLTLAGYLAIAVLASLIPASRLIRRGDVRFKTANELESTHIDFVEAVKKKLEQIADDLERLTPFQTMPLLVSESAIGLDKLPPLEIDAVITSPPYLNGTNYFRNTKVELWFLRCLTKSADLAAFRYRAITAGINDVTIGKISASGNQQQSLRRVLEDLQEDAYDRRIPQMVLGYFNDMKASLAAIKRHLSKDAVVAIDIGDSAYGSVHVPTDSLLKELFEEDGLEFQYDITLRQRTSRNGLPLRQTLLVFRNRGGGARVFKPADPQNEKWIRNFTLFKKELPHQKGEFAKRNWGHPLHSLCSYQGKMKPSLASHLVKAFVRPGDVLLDPFAGVGTIPFEAALQGVKAWGFDISPPAVHIATAKLGRPDSKQCQELITDLNSFIDSYRPKQAEREAVGSIRFNGALADYFQPETFREILAARKYFQSRPPATVSESLVLACLLHILHGNRPYALSRRSHPITPFAPTGPGEYRALIPRLQEKVGRSLKVDYPNHFARGACLFQDATAWWPQDVDGLDAIITSPPFFDSTRFYLANWMRLWFCGWESDDFKNKPLAFVDEMQKTSFAIYEPLLRQARERLKRGGVVVLHLGKSRKCDMAEALSKVARRWFSVADIFSESVNHCQSHGIKDQGTVETHQFLILS